jgi:lantibiotic modifying enzyme
MESNKEVLIQECINKLRTVSKNENKFAELQKKLKGRFLLSFAINIGEIGKMKAGFDNHKNHQRPHIHVETNSGRISIAIDNGELLHNKNSKLKENTLREIREWILKRKECLRLIYHNIQNCKSGEDFIPIINAMNRYL